MVASENLLRLAMQETQDPVLNRYYAEHLLEEKNHAKWLADDLASGAQIDVKRTEVPLEAAEMVGFVYYSIFHIDACALLGYMLLMEANAWSLKTIEEYEQEYGTVLLRTLKYHAEHDPGHAAEVRDMIFTLEDRRRKIVNQTFAQCAKYVERAFKTFRKHPCPST